jgi:hypothetical protein
MKRVGQDVLSVRQPVQRSPPLLCHRFADARNHAADPFRIRPRVSQLASKLNLFDHAILLDLTVAA